MNTVSPPFYWRASESQWRAVRTELYKVLLPRPLAAGEVVREAGLECDPKSLVGQIFRVVEQVQR